MIVFFVEKYPNDDTVEQSEKIISELQWILNYLRTGENLTNLQNRIVQVQNDREYIGNSYLYFVNKVIMCVELSYDFLSFVRKGGYMTWMLPHNRLTYLRLKEQLVCLTNRSNLCTTWEDIISDDYFTHEVYRDGEERILLRYTAGNFDFEAAHDFERLHNFFTSLTKIDKRNELMETIETLYGQIIDAFRVIYLPFEQVLDDCCNMLEDHLKTRRVTRKYFVLKRRLKHVQKKRERIANLITYITERQR